MIVDPQRHDLLHAVVLDVVDARLRRLARPDADILGADAERDPAAAVAGRGDCGKREIELAAPWPRRGRR